MHLDAIAGHERARGFLRRAMADGRVSHAYLFTGPAGVGKTATALAFATDLLEAAGSPRVTPAHPDLWVEDGDGETIGIDTIRLEARVARGTRGEGAETADEAPAKAGKALGGSLAPWPPPVQSLQAFLALKGMHSDRRVAVLARAERLRETAAAPLLKTIEEPPEGAVLIVCTENADLLPATIRSRCQEVEFGRLRDIEVETFLAARTVAMEPAALRLAGGCPGRALRLAADPEGVARRLDWDAALRRLRGGDWLDVVSLGARFGGPDSRANRVLAREAMEVWEAGLRDLAVALAGAPELAAAGVEAAGVTVEDAVSLWRSARETADRVQSNVNPRLAIEVFLSEVARGRGALVEAVGSEYLSAEISGGGAANPPPAERR
ncbi:MAG TPA: hypothetical protein VG245_11400 [Candidatus Dormibacteraeota bacterium]|jgi:DNA polymerase-3 subunit delta'|nr:hypothetical protein [Candidatus Dormibacteraeota bacterium]